jgi:hypothetical protein
MGGAGVRGFLGLALPDMRRQLLIQVPSATEIHPNDFPRWHGLEISVFDGDVADIRPGRFYLLGERTREPTAVYAALIEDLWSHIADLGDWPGVANELRQRLARWDDFFANVGAQGLSLGAQRGLFGELWFLSEQLVPVTGALRAVDGWVGQRQAHQDFQLQEAAIEIKTSTAKQLIEIRIASERQLDDRGLPPLYLTVLLLTELEAGGEALPERVGKVRELASQAGVASSFEEKLREAGYVDEQAEMYRRGYVVRSFHAFAVGNGFPRLLEEDLPNGVGDVSYSIDLALARSYEVATGDPGWWSRGEC